MSDTPVNVLFLCTGNSARSILGEAILNRIGHGRFRGYSAGSYPTGKVNPVAIELLDRHGHETSELRSKSWDEYNDAPAFNIVITVCDSAAKETCPIWIGEPVTVHWGLPDPAAIEDEDEKRRAFDTTYRILESRLAQLIELPIDSMSRAELKATLKELQ